MTNYIPTTMSLNDALAAIEKQMIQRSLEQANNVQAVAAEKLGIKKNVMQYKMKKYNIQ